MRRRENRVKSDRNTCVRGPSSTRFFEGCMGKNRMYFEYIQIFTISAIFFILILLELFYYVHGYMFEESILERENIEDIYDKKRDIIIM